MWICLDQLRIDSKCIKGNPCFWFGEHQSPKATRLDLSGAVSEIVCWQLIEECAKSSPFMREHTCQEVLHFSLTAKTQCTSKQRYLWQVRALDRLSNEIILSCLLCGLLIWKELMSNHTRLGICVNIFEHEGMIFWAGNKIVRERNSSGLFLSLELAQWSKCRRPTLRSIQNERGLTKNIC